MTTEESQAEKLRGYFSQARLAGRWLAIVARVDGEQGNITLYVDSVTWDFPKEDFAQVLGHLKNQFEDLKEKP